jgi:tetratricopeptide (TPR) repeat protein
VTRNLLAPYQKFIHPSERQMMLGISQVSKIPEDTLQKAFVCPELQNWLLVKIQALTGPMLACSSFVTHDADHRVIFGRNMDYSAAGVLDQNLSVYLVKPQGKAKMLTVSPRGFVLPGLSGMNEFGLSLSLNTVFSKKLSSSRTIEPILSINREVLENAATIQEALIIYERYHYMSGWLIQIADAQGASGVVELSGIGVRFVQANEKGISAASNSYQSPDQKSLEIGLTPGVQIHNEDRLKRLYSLAEGKILRSRNDEAIREAVKILADSYSPYGDIQAVFSTSGIRSVEQVMSMIFLPTERAIWVANNSATPTSLAPEYIKFSFHTMEEASVQKIQLVPPEISLPENLILPESSFDENQAAQKALHAFVMANTAATQEDNKLKVYEYLKEAVALSPDCSFHLFLASYAVHFALTYLSESDFHLAKKTLDKSKSCPILNPHQKAIAYYLSGVLNMQAECFESASKDLREADRIETDLMAEMAIVPDHTLLRSIRYYLKAASRKTKGIGQWYWGNPNLLIEIKIGDRVLGWNL